MKQDVNVAPPGIPASFNTSARRRAGTPTRSVMGHSKLCPQLDDVLSGRHFIDELRREKRRAERSHAPLSIVVFEHFNQCSPDFVANSALMLESLCRNKRETDVVGYLGEGLVAILLPHTSLGGAQAFAEKMAEPAFQCSFGSVATTYPDQVFDQLLEGHDRSNLNPPVLNALQDARPARHAAKRLLDVVGSLSAIVLLSPIMLCIALLVKTTPGPVIFSQVRLGRGGRPFVFYKFRSMYVNNDDRVHREYLASLIKGDGRATNHGNAEQPHYKLKGDARITRVGRIIRNTSLDELPQFFNVLRGDMSLVGPRPPLPYEAQHYELWHLRRILDVRPGLTGLWQVEGRSRTSFDEMVRMDLRYIRNESLWLDFKILLKTVVVVIRGDGAS